MHGRPRSDGSFAGCSAGEKRRGVCLHRARLAKGAVVWRRGQWGVKGRGEGPPRGRDEDVTNRKM